MTRADRAVLIFILIILGLTVCGMMMAIAYAHEGDSPLAVWYRSLKTPDGGSCCDQSDCRPVSARLVEDHWEVTIAEGWQPVPEQAVLKRNNADGRPIACVWFGRILCFVPPAGS